MPDILLAMTKALAGVPGLAPIFNPLIALREEEKLEKSNAALIDKIVAEQDISRDILKEILLGVHRIRQYDRVLSDQMVGGFYAVIKIIQRHQSKAPLLKKVGPSSLPDLHPDFEERLSSLVEENRNLIAAEGLISREALRDELIRLFSDDVKTLLAVAQPAGFPKGWVSTTVAPIQAYYSFLETCEGLDNRQVAEIAQALSRKKPGSAILRAWASMYAPYLNRTPP